MSICIIKLYRIGLTYRMLGFDRKQKGRFETFDLRHAWNECAIVVVLVGHFALMIVQVAVYESNQPPNDGKCGPRTNEAHRKHQYRPAPFHIDQSRENVLNTDIFFVLCV